MIHKHTFAVGCLVWLLVSGSNAIGQLTVCDPAKVVSSESCAKCHAGEVRVWQQTPHFQTFEQLHRDPRAKEIAQKMGQRSIKRGDLCVQCHYTRQESNGRVRAISGVSCESCHGAARDWLDIHNNYGGPTVARESETPTHAQQRIAASIAAGMRNPKNLYLVAQSCLGCHTVPNERLVNHGTHKAGSEQFELVAWSQGMLRHNFLRTNGEFNAPSPPKRLRVMFVVGKIADLEFSTRATALATERGTYGLTVANRAASLASELYEIQQLVNDPMLEQILKSFAAARLATNNAKQLNEIADEINRLGIQFAEQVEPEALADVDVMLPKPAQYK